MGTGDSDKYNGCAYFIDFDGCASRVHYKEREREMNELDRLEYMLKKNNIPYERIDEEGNEMFPYLNRHQICVPSEKDRKWDAICHYGSYGYKEGLLEIYGDIVVAEDGDSVVGFLTAEDVMKRALKWAERKNDETD